MAKGDAYGQSLQELAANTCCKEFVHQLVRSLSSYEIGVEFTQTTKWIMHKFSHPMHQT